jgi:hypothetical protein
MCFGQIVAFDKDLKDCNDDYVAVSVVITSSVSNTQTYWVGSWGRDTLGNYRMSKTKDLKLIGTIAKAQNERSQLKDAQGNILALAELSLFNLMSKNGWSYRSKEVIPMMPINNWSTELMSGTTYLFERRR